MKEANIQTAFGRYLQSSYNIFRNKSVAFEIKLINLHKKQKLVLNSSNSNSNTVKNHQIEGLLLAKKGLYHKISDSPIFSNNKSRFTWKKPFDCVFLSVNESYIGIAFYIPKKLNNLYLVAIDDFLKLKNSYRAIKKVSINYEDFVSYFGNSLIKINLKPWMYVRNKL